MTFEAKPLRVLKHGTAACYPDRLSLVLVAKMLCWSESMPTSAPYRLVDPSALLSPALLFYPELIRENVARMVEIAGRVERLRPHAKTHKCPDVARLELAAGITKQKCATLAEAEMLAQAGVRDILVAYPIVGPNCARLAQLVAEYPQVQFVALADHPEGVAQLAAAFQGASKPLEVAIDINVGQNRTGIAAGEKAVALYMSLMSHTSLRPGGLHVYDGQNNQESLAERTEAAHQGLQPVLRMREMLRRERAPLPRIVFGGTPTFPVWAKLDLPEAELSPGTCVLHDHGYGNRFPELGFTPAAVLFTRVVSRPTPDRVTFDLGYKAIASDPPAGKRCAILDLPDAKEVSHNEEHLVIETREAERFKPGDVAYAIPTHICPTVALHQWAHVVEGGKVVDRWKIVARDRVLGE
jgi:D-serine deaminase-like pyridoxal phosphate-dependent protein